MSFLPLPLPISIIFSMFNLWIHWMSLLLRLTRTVEPKPKPIPSQDWFPSHPWNKLRTVRPKPKPKPKQLQKPYHMAFVHQSLFWDFLLANQSDIKLLVLFQSLLSWDITDSYSLIFVASLRTLSSTLSHQTSITLLIVSHSILILSAPPYYIF